MPRLPKATFALMSMLTSLGVEGCGSPSGAANSSGAATSASAGRVSSGSSGGSSGRGSTAGTTSGGSAGYAQAVESDAPLAYYPMDELPGQALKDHGPNALDGTYGAAVQLGKMPLLPSSGSVAPSFPGGVATADTEARVAPSASLQPSGALTAEFALSLKTPYLGGVTDLVSYGPHPGQALSIQIAETGVLRFYLSTSTGWVAVDGATILVAGQTYLVAATYDGAVARLYLDGALEASGPQRGPIQYSAVTSGAVGLALGGGANPARRALDGQLAQVSVYGVALSGARLAAHFASTGLGGTTTPFADAGSGSDAGTSVPPADAGSSCGNGSCESGENCYSCAADCCGLQPSLPAGGNWKLVWHDEFEVDGPPNPNNWEEFTGPWDNMQVQWFQPQNATVKNGNLVITTDRVTPSAATGNFAYTSAQVQSAGLQSFMYGAIEARMQIPVVQGSWPAFWALGEDNVWPRGGEVDMMEYYGDSLNFNVLCPKGNWRNGNQNLKSLPSSWASQFHIWTMDWDADKIDLYLDGVQQDHVPLTDTADGSYNPYLHPMYLLFTEAIGGAGGDPSATQFPIQMLTDYVRVYQHPGPNMPTGGGTGGTSTTGGGGGGTGSGPFNYQSTVLGDSPIAYYRMDDRTGVAMHDSGASQLNGTYGTGVALDGPGLLPGDTSGAPHFAGGAYDVANLAQVPPSPLLEPSRALTVEFAVEFDQNPTGVAGSNTIDLVSYGPLTAQTYSVQLGSQGTLQFWVNLDSNDQAIAVGATPVVAGKVYLVDATFDGNGTTALYVNGALDGTASLKGKLNYAGASGQWGLALGGGLQEVRQTLGGRLGEVSLYGSVLSAAKVSAHYKASGL